MRGLGVAYLTGRGATQDTKQAHVWFRRAERHGSALAGRDADHLEELLGRETFGLAPGREQPPGLESTDPVPAH